MSQVDKDLIAHLRTLIDEIEAADIKTINVNIDAGVREVTASVGTSRRYELDGWRSLTIKWLV